MSHNTSISSNMLWFTCRISNFHHFAFAITSSKSFVWYLYCHAWPASFTSFLVIENLLYTKHSVYSVCMHVSAHKIMSHNLKWITNQFTEILWTISFTLYWLYRQRPFFSVKHTDGVLQKLKTSSYISWFVYFPRLGCVYSQISLCHLMWYSNYII